MSTIIGISDAKGRLSKLVDRASEGEEIVIVKNGTALARLVPIAVKGKKRKPAGALGLTFLSPDFDDPLSATLQDAYEGRSQK